MGTRGEVVYQMVQNSALREISMSNPECLLNKAYFFVDSLDCPAYVPLGKISSLHVQKGADDNYYEVVLTTVSGREFISKGFTSLETAIDFCEEQMCIISDYNRRLAEIKNSQNNQDTLQDVRDN